MLPMTTEQCAAVRESHGQPVAIVDPASQQTFYIVTEEVRQLLQDFEEEERVLAAFQRASITAVKRRLQDDP